MRRALAPVLLVLSACPGSEEPASATQREPERPSESPERPAEPERAEPAAALTTWNFDAERPGEVATGFVPGEANTRGQPATWAVVDAPDAPSAPRAFAVTESNNIGATFEVALVEDSRFDDLEIEVALKALAGEDDQGGGVVWRAAGPHDYYTARWNPIEGNFRFYVVVAEQRTKLAEVDVKLDASSWHTLKVVVEGSHADGFVDGDLVLSIDDTTLKDGGMVGLWTKADAVTWFDDLRVTGL